MPKFTLDWKKNIYIYKLHLSLRSHFNGGGCCQQMRERGETQNWNHSDGSQPPSQFVLEETKEKRREERKKNTK